MQKLLLKLMLTVLMSVVCLGAFAAKPLSGKIVSEKGEPVIGATIIEKGTSNGTTSGSDGSFGLQLTGSAPVIIVSFIGYTTEEVPIGSKSTVEVVLKEESQVLEELVVVGYGVQRKVSVTGSVVAVDSKALLKAPADNVSTMLGGKLPGLVSRQTSGLPGENDANIFIRGISTTGNSAPLVLVDGVEREFSNIDPSEIDNISVLKDAASAAVYGVRGANGVILVTTKRGSQGDSKPSITYNGAFMASMNANMPEFLDGNEYAQWRNLAADLDNTTRPYSDAELGYIRNGNDPQGILGNTDWFKLIFKPYAPGQSHSVNVSGGSNTVRYFVGGNVLSQSGIIRNVSFDRYNLRSNVDVNITKRLLLKVNMSGRIENRHQPGVTAGSSDPTASLDNGGAEMGYKNIVFYTISGNPTVNPRMPDGRYIGYQNPLIARDESGFTDRGASYVESSVTLAYDPGSQGPEGNGYVQL